MSITRSAAGNFNSGISGGFSLSPAALGEDRAFEQR
jgi:hypothetical protein